MQLSEDECWARLGAADHGVLSTVHPERGVDAVPVVFALSSGQIVMPIDTVKAKTGPRLRRLENLAQDPRCVLLVDTYSEDWTQLWWVRVHGHAVEADAGDDLVALLAGRFAPYRASGAIVSIVMLSPSEVSGWAASG